MRLSDLEVGMLIERRNGTVGIVLRDVLTNRYEREEIIFVTEDGFSCGTNYRDNLTSKNYEYFDVMRVYAKLNDSELCSFKKNGRVCLWSRENQIDITIKVNGKEINEPISIETAKKLGIVK